MLSEQSAVVTGGAQGIGLATSRLLLQSGAKVVTIKSFYIDLPRLNNMQFISCHFKVAIFDFSKDKLSTTFDELKKEFGADRVLSFHCDVTDEEQVVRATHNPLTNTHASIINAGSNPLKLIPQLEFNNPLKNKINQL